MAAEDLKKDLKRQVETLREDNKRLVHQVNGIAFLLIGRLSREI